MEIYKQIIHKSRYARYLDDKNRRESWEESVERYVDFLFSKVVIDESYKDRVKRSILNQEVCPSMRALMTAGEAAERENLACYNCSYLAIDSKRSFAEALYILMCGTGLGFSCERQEVDKLPAIPDTLERVDDTIIVADSKRGWALALKKLLSYLWEGEIPNIDYSRIRPAGARLKTFGGRASGSLPLKRLFQFCIDVFHKAAGRKLRSIEVHDILCMIGEIVVVGGVRRSALISLSNLSDTRMRNAKSGDWWIENPQRSLANNSVAYTEKPDVETFIEEWLALIRSRSGERGIFNRVAAQKQAARNGLRSVDMAYGVNPCGEIVLRNKGLCNLSEVIVRSNDNIESLKHKIEIATIIGTIQSTLTNFNFLSEDWKRNAEEERLLGVSLSGIMDNPLLNNNHEKLGEILTELKEHARKINEKWSEILGIPVSAAITTIKPSGTVSQLVDCASGIHARHAPYYIRRIRMDKKDPMYTFLKVNGVSVEDDVHRPDNTAVLSFPIKSPDGAVCRNDISAIEQLELWKTYKTHYTEHNPSITVTVREDEWLSVGEWVYNNFNDVLGISFLPHSDHIYQQAPYEEIDKGEYERLVTQLPTDLDWSKMVEETDVTTSSQELACTAGQCDI